MEKIKAPAWLTEKPIAHRGLHSEVSPENSMAAFISAADNKYPIELDVHLTKDGKIVVFHDSNIKRMCGEDKLISELNYAELKEYRLKKTNERIPLLSEVLKYCENKVPLLIEIKAEKKIGRLETALYLLLRTYKGQFAVQSFNPFSVRWFKKNAPQMVRGQLASMFEEDEMSFLKKFLLRSLFFNFLTKPQFVSYHVKDIPNKYVERARKKGVKILAWTVTNQLTYEEKKLHIDNIIFENFIPKK